jgi:hypothetical protein
VDNYEEEIQRQARQHRDSLRFAEENWDDPQFQATANAVIRNLEEQAAAEAAAGLHVR